MYNKRNSSKELHEILDGLVDNLNIQDIIYILMNRMKKEDVKSLDIEGAFPSDDLYFELTAELKSGSEDDDGDENEEYV